jgi:hypothetical protein
LKAGLLELANENWVVVNSTGEIMEILRAGDWEAPPEDVRQHFLSTFRVRIQVAASRKASLKVGFKDLDSGNSLGRSTKP